MNQLFSGYRGKPRDCASFQAEGADVALVNGGLDHVRALAIMVADMAFQMVVGRQEYAWSNTC